MLSSSPEQDNFRGFDLRGQARSQEFAMGGCFWGLGAEPPALENFAFFCKNKFILGLFW